VITVRAFLYIGLAMLAIAAAGCGGTSPVGGPVNRAVNPASSTSTPIQHVVLVVQENRTFNNFFATFPGADGTTTGQAVANYTCNPPIEAGPITLTKANLILPKDLDHRYVGYQAADDGGNMDGFDNVPFGNGQPECTYPYMYTDPNQIVPYWDMATQYTLAEHMFTMQGSDSFTAHQALIAGSTIVKQGEAMIDFPTCSGPLCYWGCDAPAATRTHLVTEAGVELKGAPGPFPCTSHFATTYRTMRRLLDAKAVSWKYYVPPSDTEYGKLFSAFDLVASVRYGSEWKTNVITPQTQIFNDITNGALANVSWVIPDEQDSDHPGQTRDTGPSWVASVVNALGQSSYWDSTAIVIVWDDWGGLYDNLAPQQAGYGGLGFRVPAIVVSPYAKAGYISKTNYDFGSILKYIENNWDLGNMGGSDKNATSILDCFNYSQKPIPFTVIPSSYGKAYFLHRKPSFKRIDDDM
jgi:phospholipase C